MLLARLSPTPTPTAHRLGVNYQQIPVNRAAVPGAQLQQGRGDAGTERVRPGLRAELEGRPGGRRRRATPSVATWDADGEFMRAAYTLHAEDDDWGQAGTLVREVIDDAARDRLVDNVVGHLLDGVSEPVLRARVRVLAQHRQGRSATASPTSSATSRSSGVAQASPVMRASRSTSIDPVAPQSVSPTSSKKWIVRSTPAQPHRSAR